jgi:hypothetical protein
VEVDAGDTGGGTDPSESGADESTTGDSGEGTIAKLQKKLDQMKKKMKKQKQSDERKRLKAEAGLAKLQEANAKAKATASRLGKELRKKKKKDKKEVLESDDHGSEDEEGVSTPRRRGRGGGGGGTGGRGQTRGAGHYDRDDEERPAARTRSRTGSSEVTTPPVTSKPKTKRAKKGARSQRVKHAKPEQHEFGDRDDTDSKRGARDQTPDSNAIPLSSAPNPNSVSINVTPDAAPMPTPTFVPAPSPPSSLEQLDKLVAGVVRRELNAQQPRDGDRDRDRDHDGKRSRGFDYDGSELATIGDLQRMYRQITVHRPGPHSTSLASRPVTAAFRTRSPHCVPSSVGCSWRRESSTHELDASADANDVAVAMK